MLQTRRHDIQYNDILYNDTQHSDSMSAFIMAIRECNTQHNDTHHNGSQWLCWNLYMLSVAKKSIMLNVIMLIFVILDSNGFSGSESTHWVRNAHQNRTCKCTLSETFANNIPRERRELNLIWYNSTTFRHIGD
jgi:hypothetical protein